MRNVLAITAVLALVLGSTAIAQQSQTSEPQYSQGQQIADVASTIVPAGTQVSIRTNEQITADETNAGRQFSGEISQDIIGESGQVLIPRSSPATLTVGKVSSGSLGVQSNEVALGLQSVTVNGRTYNVAANDVQQQSGDDRGLGANKRTAVMTGGGAALGTLVGAIAGGGKGAAIGALVGGGGGAAAQVLTRGKNVNIPAETVLTFRLDQPISLR